MMDRLHSKERLNELVHWWNNEIAFKQATDIFMRECNHVKTEINQILTDYPEFEPIYLKEYSGFK